MGRDLRQGLRSSFRRNADLAARLRQAADSALLRISGDDRLDRRGA